MALTSNRRGISALLCWGLVARVVCACAVDGWALQNAGWICALLGSLLCAPLALMMWFMQKANAAAAPSAVLDAALGQWARRALCLVLCAASLYEASVDARFATLSAAYSSFDQASGWALIAITIAAATVCCIIGANGVAGAPQVFSGLIFFILIVTWGARIQYTNYRWLTPILGPGWPVLIKGSLSVAGIETMMIAAWLCMGEDNSQRPEGGRPYRATAPAHMLRVLGLLMLISVALMLLIGMIAPATPAGPNERDYALERFLANGRIPIAVQLPVMFNWLAAQIVMVVSTLFFATAMLSQSMPKIPPWLCALLCGGASVALALSPVASRTAIDIINTWRYAILTAALVPFAIAHLIKQRRLKNAQA